MSELLLFSVDSPLQAGIYEEGRLVKRYEREGRIGEELPPLLAEILRAHDPKALYYLQGPGSFTAIKLSYLFLQTLSIARNLPLYGADSFTFNGNAPIKAYGNHYFIKEKGEILTRPLETPPPPAPSILPEVLDRSLFIPNPLPLYVLPPL